MYKYFRGIPFGQNVPDETALMKITTKYGNEVISEINQRLLESLVKKELIKGKSGKCVEFGYKVQIQEVEGGIITGY
jgi:hypothetical protein